MDHRTGVKAESLKWVKRLLGMLQQNEPQDVLQVQQQESNQIVLAYQYTIGASSTNHLLQQAILQKNKTIEVKSAGSVVLSLSVNNVTANNRFHLRQHSKRLDQATQYRTLFQTTECRRKFKQSLENPLSVKMRTNLPRTVPIPDGRISEYEPIRFNLILVVVLAIHLVARFVEAFRASA